MSASPSDSPAEILRTCQELYAALPMKETAELGRILSTVRGSHGLRWKECADFEFMKSLHLKSLTSMYDTQVRGISQRWRACALCSVCQEPLADGDVHRRIVCGCGERVVHKQCTGSSGVTHCFCCEEKFIINDTHGALS